MHVNVTIRKTYDAETQVGIRLRSWALPLLVTFTPTLKEIAIGPLYASHERFTYLPF